MNDNRKSFTLSPIGASAKWFFAVMTLLPVLIIAFIWWSNPDEFRAFVKAEIDKWEQVIVKSGAKMD